ncbi:MAG: DEAD/DEAH box helicase [Prevotella sp.]
MELETIIGRLGIEMSPMQQATMDAFTHTEGNIEVLSPTGSGKTLAYLLPLSQLIDASSDSLQAVVIVPGRELAIQSADVLASMKAGIRGYACHGGRPTMDEHREIRKLKPQIIFATPGRLNDHIDKGNIETNDVKFVVIDEFDKCLQMGFAEEMNKAVLSMPRSARRIFLSATDVSADELVNTALSPVGFDVVDYRDESHNEDRIKVNIVHSPDKDKLPILAALLRCFKGDSTIVFLNYRDSVERTAVYLTDEGFTVSAYHGGLDQRQREEAIYRFANGSANVLVSTNLGSRGLDIPDVKNIVHYHLPETEEDYTHRIGRTARWDKEGNTYFILSECETLPEYVQADTIDFSIPEELPRPVAPRMVTLYIGKGKKDKISKGDVVGFLCKSGGLKGAEIGRIDVYDYYAYAAIERSKLKSVLHNVQGEKLKGQKTKVEPAS